MQNSLVDFSADDLQKGFRLHRLEVYNWGTFNEKVWKIEPSGSNSLLTGDIGSGKSTLVDAILTLLVPHQKIVYNKAAGAESKERTINSYVRGEYKNQRSDYSNSSPVYLRKENDYSVLLARFYNKGFDSGYTLAQIFWIRNGTVEKLFIISKLDLNIKDHFKLNNDDRDISALKKRLKSSDQVEVFESFRDYSSKFRSYFGIKSEKVLELFYQTVSMKSVGKLTEFMRNHMLEKLDVKDKIDEIKNNFENLTKSHEAVQRAKLQLEQLTPLVDEISDYQKIYDQNIELKRSIEFIPVFFADEKSKILDQQIQLLNRIYEQTEQELTTINSTLNALRSQKDEISLAISQNKEGQRLNQLDNEIKRLEKEKQVRYDRYIQYSNLSKELAFLNDPDDKQFNEMLNQAEKLKITLETNLSTLDTERDLIMGEYIKLRESKDIEKNELDSLTKRKSKIPDKNIQVRELIINELGLEESDLPFVGELLQIKTGEKSWEGAIERVLHNFGLSLLVADRYYKEVSSFVDRTNLRGRIVYYRIPNNFVTGKRKEIEQYSLINKMDIKTDSEFCDWISNELNERFNFTCCESIEQFQRELRAITKNGQIKGNRGRHEKDDEKNIHDQRYYVLGWNNIDKVKLIKETLIALDKKLKENEDKQNNIKAKKALIDKQKTTIHDYIKFRDYSEINWKIIAQDIEKFRQDIDQLKKASNQLSILKSDLDLKLKDIEYNENRKSEHQTKMGELNNRILTYKENLLKCEQLLSESSYEHGRSLIPIIQNEIQNKRLDIKTIDEIQNSVTKTLKMRLDTSTSAEGKLRDKIISKMQKFKNDYPEDTIEIISGIESVNEYIQFYNKIKSEDLPRYEERFKKMLNEGTINDIAIFKSRLETNAKQIEKNIKTINDSLKTIEYSNGTYIELLSVKIQDVEIKTFQSDLRDCLEGILGEKNPYNEGKFNQVKKILDRFNSGNPVDIAWTNKVTDVRNWYEFSAVEKYQSDNSEKEFYSDSSGKSGGQKEKLAYTILASALAYQFGPAGDNPTSKSFRFVMIDEAFGRGSDESTRYGMDLFKKLDLQLLIITPLQKIHIIENYINCVHFVSNSNGYNSMSRDIPIQEYQKEKLNKSVIGE